ncbi:quinone oxidoreductase-like protein 2 isoform X1 [Dioscorea cayenensis subsp. rotundata]|uniref:Quinone oxidoreductase-like protein 2 isoform X1 n=1 Tax=Dioscorea cayennensis subsp. rotundata TaxID=55577 RepID=A0AB40BU17_DIOCR|nr:quinone oxidoreductase-like protein 2 isoform X1 [Dioscorea cayenensis subsp. rotundata]
MEALLCEKLGDPVVPITSPASPITLAKTHPIPSLTSPTSVRVRVHATSLNYANYLQILGKYQEKPPLPFIPGSDYSGVVEAVGEAVSRFKVGDRVCSVAGLGSFAEFIVDDEKDLQSCSRKVVEQGPHEILLSREGRYAELWINRPTNDGINTISVV